MNNFDYNSYMRVHVGTRAYMHAEHHMHIRARQYAFTIELIGVSIYVHINIFDQVTLNAPGRHT